MGHQPNLQNIDREIRSLIYFLNEISYVQTTVASCSGHPDDPNRYWWPTGFICLQPVDDDIRAFWEFLDSLRVKLNETDPKMFEFSRRAWIDAQELYASTEPLVKVGLGISFSQTRETDSLEFWRCFIDSIQGFLGQAECVSIETPVEGANLLVKWLNSIPYIQHIRDFIAPKKDIQVDCQAAWNYESCQWCWDLLKYMKATLSEVWKADEDGNPPFSAGGNFQIKLIVKSPDVNRTRQEHSKMWNLLEAAVLQLEPQLEQVNLPAECQPLTLAEKAKKARREAKRIEEKRTLNELVARQAYQRLYEQVRPTFQEILVRHDIENQETLEDEILSFLSKNLHHFRPELVSFETWLSRVTLNLVVKRQKQKEGINHNDSRIQITIQGE